MVKLLLKGPDWGTLRSLEFGLLVSVTLIIISVYFNSLFPIFLVLKTSVTGKVARAHDFDQKEQ